MAARKSRARIVAGPSGPPAPKAWKRGRTPVSEALEALDVGKSIVLEQPNAAERMRARSSARYLMEKLGRRYATRTLMNNDLAIWRTE